MPDPTALTAAAIGAAALTEGIKFLYGQAGEILKQWRERRDKAAQESTARADQTESTEVVLPDAFEGNLENPKIHFDRVQASETHLRELRRDLSDYAEDIDVVDKTDSALLEKVDALRNLLEAIYGQRITFKGENRPASGIPVVAGRVDAGVIAGQATGVDAEAITTGEVRGGVKADEIKEGGSATGVKAGTIGSKSS
jgi:hypothetical protein